MTLLLDWPQTVTHHLQHHLSAHCLFVKFIKDE